jgi:phage FluMu gp28-like protein
MATKTRTSRERITLDPAQRRFVADTSRVQVVCWHRQKGKDFAAAATAVLHAMQTGEPWYIVSLTQRQADATFDKCRFWARYYRDRIGEVIERERQFTEYDADIDELFAFKARELELPNGGRVVSLPGKDPDRLAGLTGNVIFTEFGLFPNGGYDHWRVVFPLATRGHHVIAISTPRGKSTKFYELVHQPELYSVHLCDIHQSIAEGFILTDQDGKPCTLEAFKALYGDDIGFAREYELQFTGDLAALVSWALLEAAAARGADEPFDCIRVEGESGWTPGFFCGLSNVRGGRYELGWDVARHGHLSVLAANQRSTRGGGACHLRVLILMRGVSFALQRSIVREAMEARPDSVGAGDATGLGEDSNETLEGLFPRRWEGVNFAGVRKSELGSGLFTAFRDGNQLLPAMGTHKYIAADVYAVQRQTDEERGRDDQGKTRLVLTETENPLLPESHCDIAWSLALAIRAGHMVSLAAPKASVIW